MAAPKPSTNGGQPRPNHTLYCSNLPDKLPKDDLKRALYMIFSVYGPILDIVSLKTAKMRGQAHVLFRDVSASAQAMRAVQGSEFFGKQMKISYSTTKSDTLSKLDGTFKQPAPQTATAAAENQASTLQQSIFAGPPGTSAPAATGASEPPPGLESTAHAAAAPSAQGLKRAREESDDEKEEAPMDMDDEAMEESDSE